MLAMNAKDQDPFRSVPARFVRTGSYGLGQATQTVIAAEFLSLEPESEGYDPYDHAPMVPHAE